MNKPNQESQPNATAKQRINRNVDLKKMHPDFFKENPDEFMENYKNLYRVLTMYKPTVAIHNALKSTRGRGYYLVNLEDGDYFIFAPDGAEKIEKLPGLLNFQKLPTELDEFDKTLEIGGYIEDVPVQTKKQIAQYYGVQICPVLTEAELG